MAISLPEPDNFHFNEQPESRSGGYQYYFTNLSSVSEIEEENSTDLFEINHRAPIPSIKEEFEEDSPLPFNYTQNKDDFVYVAVGKSDSSMDALSWTLKHAVNPSTTTVFLVHVFPEIRLIPSPLGKLPRNQVSSEMVEQYMVQERGRRRELLQKFLDECSFLKVKVDTMLIESDMVGKAILDLIPILNIRKLVVGISKSNLRKLRAKRGNGIADLVVQSAQDTCDIHVVCEGQEIIDHRIWSYSPRVNDYNSKSVQQRVQNNNSVSCICFKPRVL